ncbi:HD_domain domain-containing protein [Candidatus Hydrogenisulfobacillus filiaventi]|uniref:HD_domain domain-containing protein n=1 Tax=Candidatus Hydrogenisulfobacillus filiaventi TaxID=2707344 RepID=A0A6F8ZG83_9FIRM|nr:HD_domain domain-containing protein [Candidatus Hydrogenisulfobacillus filiaventi]
MGNWPPRVQAWDLLTRWTHQPALLRHAIAVEAVMRAIARRYGEDEDLFGLVGLLHDFDYEAFPAPEDHTVVGGRLLEEAGFPPVIVRAVRSHVDRNGLRRESVLEKALYASDELTGFVLAVAMVRPGRRLAEVTPAAVRRKLKDKSFARGVSREAVERGLEELGVTLEDHVALVVAALQPLAEDLGLNP